MSDETTIVRFEVVEFRRLHGARDLLALATVEIDLGGVAIVLHGVQARRLPNGKIQARAPHYRTPTGEWAPAITLPDELERAIGAEILALVTESCT
jgi:hypothetical protein